VKFKSFYFTFTGEPDFEEVDRTINDWLEDIDKIDIKDAYFRIMPEVSAVYLLITIFYVES